MKTTEKTTISLWKRTNSGYVGVTVALVIFLANVFDGVVTHLALMTGRAVELNPIMGWFYSVMGVWFLAPKLAIAAIASFLIWKHWRAFRVARVGGFIVAGVYLALVTYQMFFVVWRI